MKKEQELKKPTKRNPDAVKADILRIAMSEFAENGLSGARIDEIAAKTKTSKRMIYYYFGDKESLYVRVLEAAYAKVRKGEEDLNLDGLSPEKALAKLVGFTFDHHRKNPDFIRMVMIENVHRGEHLLASSVIRNLNTTAIDKLATIIKRGETEHSFRPGLDPISLHWKISALSFFNVSNQPTFSALFGNELFSKTGQQILRDQTVEMVLNHVSLHKGQTHD